MNIQKMNQDQHKINAYILAPGTTHDEETVNVAQYIQTAARFPADTVRDDENACEYDAKIFARAKSIQHWLDCMHDVDAAVFEVAANELHDYYIQYLGFCEDSQLYQFYPK